MSAYPAATTKNSEKKTKVETRNIGKTTFFARVETNNIGKTMFCKGGNKSIGKPNVSARVETKALEKPLFLQGWKQNHWKNIKKPKNHAFNTFGWTSEVIVLKSWLFGFLLVFPMFAAPGARQQKTNVVARVETKALEKTIRTQKAMISKL